MKNLKKYIESMEFHDFTKINDWLWETPSSYRKDMLVSARVYASENLLRQSLKDRSILQLINGATLPGIAGYTLAMPDCHEGYSVPIGFVGAMRIKDGIISPGATGFDISCGVRLLKTEYKEEDIKNRLRKLVGEMQKRIPSGLGKGRQVKIDKKTLRRILERGSRELVEQGYGTNEDISRCESLGRLDWADADCVSDYAKNRGRSQVGTLGSGNHFLEIQKVEKIFDERAAKSFGLFKGQLVIMIHCGSRGLGHQVCTDYLKEFAPLMFNKYRIGVPDREFACVPFSSPEGERYFRAMAAAANYAFSNRQMITHFVREAWQGVFQEKESSLTTLYDVTHNIIKKEEHIIEGKSQEVAVYRKGATRAFPPGSKDIPQEYRETGQPVLLPGTMGTSSYVMVGKKEGEASFFSTAHGAGRTMSRKKAHRSISGKEVAEKLQKKGILISCQSQRGLAEEAPLAYKNVEDVVEVAHNAGLSGKVAKLIPLAVIKGE